MKKQALQGMLLTMSLSAGCADDDGAGMHMRDAGRDAGGDASRDADLDAAPGAELDAALDADLDAARDAADALAPEASVEDASADAALGDAAPSDAAPSDAGADGGGSTCDASAAPTLPALRLEPVPGVGELPRLVFAAQPPGSSDWYLVQQDGTIRVLSGGTLQPAPFIDVSAETPIYDDADERGLVGLAFPPDYASSGKLYVAITATAGEFANADRVYEYQRSEDGTTATRGKLIVGLPVSAANHNGGTLRFGPDGLLYYGSGDGGGSCNNTNPGSAQDTGSLFGKILRLDLSAAEPYAAAGNPFGGESGDPRVLHYGLRNPFRFGFDRATGDLFIGDVGQNDYEEVDYAPAGVTGLNFGWPRWEGAQENTCGDPAGPLRPGSTHTPPIANLPRFAGATGPFADYKSVISGTVYRGTAIPQLSGVYLFGDYVGARMGALYQCGTQTSEITLIAKNRDPNAPNQPGFSAPATFTALTAIVEDGAGELYFVANRSTLWKVVPGD